MTAKPHCLKIIFKYPVPVIKYLADYNSQRESFLFSVQIHGGHNNLLLRFYDCTYIGDRFQFGQ